jgi:oligosaccharide repeat unit polymerase
MSSLIPPFPALGRAPMAVPAAAFEVLGYLAVVAVATVCFLAGWLPVNGAVVLTVVLLATLIVLSWIRLGQGRHPALLFLCALMLFQGGRLIGYCLGGEPDPMRVVAMTPAPFSVSRHDSGLVLLALSLSAICIYAPCRWLYRPVAPPCRVELGKYLPYLYILFVATLPVQLFKNYRYYEYVQQHGGYAFIYVNHAAIASSVPFWVRAIPLISLPVFVAIFVFERRKFRLYLATALYFATASLILLLGSRSGPFLLVAALWWVARVKSRRKTRIVLLATAVMALLMVAYVIQVMRQDEQGASYKFSAVRLIVSQGASLNVTEVGFKYRDLFSPYFGSYLLAGLQDAFVASDAANYHRGRSLAIDVSVFLNAARYEYGYGTAGSYLPEAYVGGGMIAVVLVSIALGLGLHAFYRFSGNALLLFVFAMSIPDIVSMPKGGLLDWASIFLRNCVSFAMLWFGWKVYSLLLSIRQTPPADRLPGIVTA